MSDALGNTPPPGPGPGNDPDYVRPDSRAESPDIAALVHTAITDALRYVDEDLVPARAQATEYYHGLPFGNEEEGRSHAVMTDVRDNILGVLPSLLRVLHGPEHVVEFVPRRADGVAAAEQATDYIRFVYEEDNAGFLITHSLLKDGLLKKLGVVTWGMDETPRTVTTAYRGIRREEMVDLPDGADIVASKRNADGTYDIEVRQQEPGGRAWVMPVPPDDFFWNRTARSLDDALVVGHRQRLTRGQLRAMGVPEAVLEEYGAPLDIVEMTHEERARRPHGALDNDPKMGEGNDRILYCEAYMMLDVHGTGIPELRKVCTIGNTHYPVWNRPARSRPYAIYSPDPEPHAFLGGSWYDLLKDVQRINSQLLRGTLDSLAISLFPRPVYVDGQASVADILNTAIGAPVRERQPGMVRWDNAPFAGDKVLPVMELMRDIVERRVGQKDGAGSLDMDALQSTGKEAANAAILAAQGQAELLARLFAEQTMKPLFRGLLQLAAHPMSAERIVRLRGKYVPVRPATWDANMDVSVNVALGSMDTAKKVAVLSEVVADQSAIMQQFGPDNPIVTVPMLRNAKARILALNGIRDVDAYYKPVPDDWQPPPPPPPEPSEEDKWRMAEAEMAYLKAMKELAIKQDELALRARELDQQAALKAQELAIKERDSVHEATIGPHNADIERFKAEQEAENTRLEIASRERIEAAKLAFEREKLAATVKARANEPDGGE